MKNLKGIIAGVVSLCMFSTMVTSVSADSFEDFFNGDILATIGDSSQSDKFVEIFQEYKDNLKELEDLQNKIEDVKKELEDKEFGSPEFEKFHEQLEGFKEYMENKKEDIEELKEKFEDMKEHHWGDIEIGDSDDIDDIDDIQIGESGDKKHHHHHHHHEFKEDKWHGSISCDFLFTNNNKFKDKDLDGLKESVLALMDAYEDTEVYIADGTEDWWLKHKFQLSVKISSDEGDYKVEFNPIIENGEVTSCYMYIDVDDEITEGYFITADEYATLKTSLNEGFLKDDVVARKNNIKDYDEFMEFIDKTYEKQEDYFYDVDGNGDVNTVDLVDNKRYVLGMEVEFGNFDCNNDNETDARDILQLKKKLLGMDI